MILVTPEIRLSENDLQFQPILSSGPGGQNVNKVATAVQLRFDVGQCPEISDEVRKRLVRLAGTRMTKSGELVITARRYRTQERNRLDAVDRLVALIRKAAEKPKPRRRTKPSLAAKRRRLEEKRQRAETKRERRPVQLPSD